MNVQNFLANFSFLSLLGTLIIYWIVTIFSNDSTNTNLLSTFIVHDNDKNNIHFVEKCKNYSDEYLYNNNLLQNSKKTNGPPAGGYGLRPIINYGIIFSNILLGLLLIFRWIDSGHFPLSNLYESLMFLSWCFTAIHIILENFTFFVNKNQFLSQVRYSELLGAITTPSALFTNAFATFTLPKDMQQVAPLVPALQSNWLIMHVTVMIISYAALILGSLLSIAYLVYTYNGQRLIIPKISTTSVTENWLFSFRKTESLTYRPETKQFAIILDSLSYRILGIGFPFLTIGILSGAVWANEAWGSYWSWDPKETWALLTWLIFAIYLHTRLNKGWQGRKPAIIASLGFIIVWICYLGVNLIGEGLHSYGWITNAIIV